MAKIAYIIPGFYQDHKTSGFSKIASLFRAKGYKVVKVKITWKYKTMSDYVEEFKSQLQHNSSDTVAVLGFSYGAMIAAISAPQVQPNKLYLCSLSPYFKEDLPRIPKYWKTVVGKRRIADFESHSFTTLAKKITAKTTLVAGSAEHELVHKRVNHAHKRLAKSVVVTAEGAKHDIGQKEYVDTLEQIIK